MTFRGFLGSLALCSVLSWLIWVFVLFRVDPDEAGIMGSTLFFITLGLAISSTASLSLLAWRSRQAKGLLSVPEMVMALRQGVFIALFAVILLILSVADALFWWSAALALAGVGGIEGLLLLTQARRHG